MNKSDTERLKNVLESIGYKASKTSEADLILINMCSVRQSAVDRVHGLTLKLNKLKSCNANLKTVLTGCMLPSDKKKLKSKFDLILNIKDLPELPKLLTKIMGPKVGSRTPDFSSSLHASAFSAYIPIMTGCNQFCAYCVVPYVRGSEINRPAHEILTEIKNLIKKGYKEIILLGQNVNSYQDKNIDFPQLLKLINNLPGNFWIRFITSHPKDLSDELIKIMAQAKKITEYLHLPIQSGDNEILKKMNRSYTAEQYKNLIRKIRKKISARGGNISISTDIIVGFPNETKKQFMSTAKLMRWAKFDMAYIARYSPRPGTAAAKLKDNISSQEKKQREKTLTKILEKTAYQNNKKYINKTIEILVLGKNKNGSFYGKTRTFKNIKIKIGSPTPDLCGQFYKCKITKANVWGLEGRLASS